MSTFFQLKNDVIYKRPHLSLGYLTQEIAHEKEGEFTKSWKVYPKRKKEVF